MVLRYLGACRGAKLILQAVCRYTIDPESTIHGWKKGQTESYLKTLETIHSTEAGKKRNWSLYALTTLLLILTHDTFHPANPMSGREKNREAGRLCTLPVMKDALNSADLSQLPFAKRTVLICLRKGWIRPVRWAVRLQENYGPGARRSLR